MQSRKEKIHMIDLNAEKLSDADKLFINTAYKLLFIYSEKTITPDVINFVSSQLFNAFSAQNNKKE